MDDALPPYSLPLDGIVVVAIEQAVAAPLATRHLADLGARVIKIERTGGGDFARDYDDAVLGTSGYFAWLNRGKESVVLNLKDPTDRATMDDLLAQADVYLQNLAPGAAARMSLAATELVSRHPRLVGCDMSGYGSTGPYAEKKAYDALIQGETGAIAVTGTPDAPAKAGISIADISGGMYALQGILAALLERERTGAGTALEVSLFDGLAEWMTQPWLLSHYGGQAPQRTGAHHASIAPYGPFSAADGTTFNIAIQNAREWVRFCVDVLDDPTLADDPRFAVNADRVRNMDALNAIVAATFRRWDGPQLEDRIVRADIAYGRLREPGDLHEHPQLQARDRWRSVDTPGGPIQALLPPVTFPGREARMGAVPAIGEHTHAVRRWLADPTQ